jgi:hypothetical protein
MTDHVAMIRAFWDACERKDYEAVGRLIGEGYTWIDHATDIVATTQEQLQAALEDTDLAWSDQKFTINRASETTDGALVLQATITQTLTGEWRSIKGTGQHVRRQVCEIFRFDTQGRIVIEELYEDALSVMRQLGAVSI